MRNLVIVLVLLTTLCQAQMKVYHSTLNGVAPVDKTVVYNTVILNDIPELTWITQNLGADRQPVAKDDPSMEAAGWYFQFNRPQGYTDKNDKWITQIYEYSEWVPKNDPCSIELGEGWRVPTVTEWDHADKVNRWSNRTEVFKSLLRLHASGTLDYYYGKRDGVGNKALYWSSSQSGYITDAQAFYAHPSQAKAGAIYHKSQGMNVRCVMTNK